MLFPGHLTPSVTVVAECEGGGGQSRHNIGSMFPRHYIHAENSYLEDNYFLSSKGVSLGC